MSYFLVIVLTLADAWADARGFAYASRVWTDDRLAWSSLAAALSAFPAGMICYVLALRYLARVSNVSISIQTAGWYVATVAGVAIITGDAVAWSWTDRLLALTSIGALTTLMIRQS